MPNDNNGGDNNNGEGGGGKNPIDAQRHLSGVDYPASKEDLVSEAKSQDAEQDVIDALQNMPDKEYNSPTDVTQALGNEM